MLRSGAELDRLRQELIQVQHEKRFADAQLAHVTDEDRVVEASQITFRMVTGACQDYHRHMLARARVEAANLRSEITEFQHAYTATMYEVRKKSIY